MKHARTLYLLIIVTLVVNIGMIPSGVSLATTPITPQVHPAPRLEEQTGAAQPLMAEANPAATIDAPLPTREITLTPIGRYKGTGAEIAAYDAKNKRLFVTNGGEGAVDMLDISNPYAPTLITSIAIADDPIYGAAPYTGPEPTSVAVYTDTIAVAFVQDYVEGEDITDFIAFFDTNGKPIAQVAAADYPDSLPDMVTFTPDGKKVLVANEGEPNDDYSKDPEGSISIIDLSDGVESLTNTHVTTLHFRDFNADGTRPLTATTDVRIFGPNATVAQDLEPEYITVAADGKTAWATLQENNAIAVIDLETMEISHIGSLGFKDFNAVGNTLDASNKDDKINMKNWPVYGMYQPDAIASFTSGNATYLVTANEGDARDYDTFSEEYRVKDLTLDATVFTDNTLQEEENLGRLKITNTLGDTDGDGKYEKLYAYGARSFSIWNTTGATPTLTYDSGDQIERITAQMYPDYFNASFDDEKDTFDFDDRSDDKGAEPEGVTVGEVDGKTYAFIGLERIGGIMVYDVSDPTKPVFVDYVNTVDFAGKLADDTAGDIAPEGVAFISKADSPTGNALVVATFEDTGSTRIYEITKPTAGDTLPHGVAAGDTTYTTTVLWTYSPVPGKITFAYGTDPKFTDPVSSTTVYPTSPVKPVKVQITGLMTDTQYHYRATNLMGDTATGTFRTPSMDSHNGLRFGVTGDWQEAPPYPSLLNASKRDLAFFVQHSDNIYADISTPAMPISQTRQLDQFRRKYAEVMSTKFGLNTMKALRGSTTILATIDDHEVTDNLAGGASPANGTPTRPGVFPNEDTGYTNDTAIYETGMRVFQEFNPLRDEYYEDTGKDARMDGERKLYRMQKYGKDAAVFITDPRSFRDAQLPDPDITDTASVQKFLADAFAAGRTMLGERQLAQLKSDLKQAQDDGVTWKFVFISEPVQNFGPLLAPDRYEGYAAERSDLLGYIDAQKIENVVFVTADFHGTVINNITYQTQPGGENKPTGAFEVMVGPAAFYSGLFGTNVVALSLQAGFITADDKAAYDAMDMTGKDAFVEQLINQQMTTFGYDTVGLEGSEINATLKKGSYVASHKYGWTEFEIDKTQILTVTTYGIEPYRYSEMEAKPTDYTGTEPTVISQFVVDPNPAPKATTLSLLHNNDGESSLLPRTSGDLEIAGVASFKSVVDREIADARTRNHSVLTVYAGDAFLASSEIQCSKPIDGKADDPVYDAIAQRQIAYDAHILGNHEFDYAPDFLERFIRAFAVDGKLTQPFLSANLDFSQETGFADLVKSDGLLPATRADDGQVLARAMIHKDSTTGQLFGVVGATTPKLATISSPRNVQIEDTMEKTAAAVQTQIDQLQAAGVNKIILVSHLQSLENDKELIGMLSGVDVAVGGGGDELLTNPNISKDLQVIPGTEDDDIEGNYPLEHQDKDGNTVYIVTGKGNYEYVGRFDVTFSAEGAVTQVMTDTSYPRRVIPTSDMASQMNITDTVTPDPDVLSSVTTPVKACTDALAQEEVVKTEVVLDVSKNSVRTKETAIGNIIVDAFLWKYDQVVSPTLRLMANESLSPRSKDNPIIAVQNGGGIRQNAGDEIELGSISRKDTLDILPFNNRLVLVQDMTPAEVKEMFEHAVERLPDEVPGEFLQVGGISVTYNISNTVGSRVVELVLADGFSNGTKLVENGAVVDGAPTISVLTIDFLANGGDGYEVLANNTHIIVTEVNGASIYYEQAFREYLQHLGTVTASMYPADGLGRITFAGTSTEPTPTGGNPGLVFLPIVQRITTTDTTTSTLQLR